LWDRLLLLPEVVAGGEEEGVDGSQTKKHELPGVEDRVDQAAVGNDVAAADDAAAAAEVLAAHHSMCHWIQTAVVEVEVVASHPKVAVVAAEVGQSLVVLVAMAAIAIRSDEAAAAAEEEEEEERTFYLTDFLSLHVSRRRRPIL
jgi:hypothetical protein